ncbi:MAG TPA: penicillin-binding protein 2 [Acidimicrobiia bacterium]|nr:penicillin-binding protein 2 [Acidimicrobiia bacterium]
MSEGNSRSRLGVIGVIVIVLFAGLFVRLWFLQVATSQSYAAETRANRIRVISEPAVRGSILDRNGKVIVKSELVNSVQIRRGITKSERKRVVPALAQVLGKTEKFINKRLDSVRYSPYQPVPITNDVPYETLVYIKERPEVFPRVDVVRRSVRVYPDGAVAPHLLGYVGAINAQEQKLFKDDGYGPEDVIGKDGVEQMFETELRGEPRERKLEVDARGRFVREISDVPAVAGNDVQLTVDLDVQRIAQESLEQGMRAAGGLRNPGEKSRFETFKATGGAAVVLDARDGSVVALSSAPAFDVTKFTDGIPAEEFTLLTDPESNYPLLDRAIQGQYPPGSTWKLFSAQAALQAGTVTVDEVILDRGFVEYGSETNKQKFKNAGEEPHGAVTLPTAIAVSSDVYFYIQGFRFWEAFNTRKTEKGGVETGYAIQRLAREYGFGKPTGIGLANEQHGRIPDQRFKQKLNKDNPDPATRSWLPGDSAALAIGQGDLLVTPLQEAVAYATFANGGTRFAPRLAERILTPGGESILRELPAQEVGDVEIPPEVRAPIMDGLINVTKGIGTAAAAFSGYGGIEVAGKTGTVEILGKQDTSAFAAIVNPNPANPEDPQYVVVVFVEEGGNGGSVAAPITRRIVEALNGNLAPANVRLVPPKGD